MGPSGSQKPLLNECRKVLTRNSLCASTTSDREGGQNTNNLSNADIMNLMSTDARMLKRLSTTVTWLFWVHVELLIGAFFVWYLLGVFLIFDRY